MKYPMTADEIKSLAATIESVVSRLHTLEDGGPGKNLMQDVNEVRVDVLGSGSNMNRVVGSVRWFELDGCWAFYPEGVDE